DADLAAHLPDERPAGEGAVVGAGAEEPDVVAAAQGGVDQVALVDGDAAAALLPVLEIDPVVVKDLDRRHSALTSRHGHSRGGVVAFSPFGGPLCLFLAPGAEYQVLPPEGPSRQGGGLRTPAPGGAALAAEQ